MTTIKTVAAAMIAWGALGAFAHAAPMSWYGGPSSWPTWYANQVQGDSQFASSAVGNVYLGGNNNVWWGNSSLPTPAPISSATTTPTASSSPSPVDAYINLGTGPYPEANSLTTGNPQAWYNSPAVVSAFGGTPTAQQEASFTQSVLSDIQHTFQISGLNISLTGDPNTTALHTLSEVSGASYPSNPGAIGITDVGNNGFGFIDKLAYATTPDQLAWAVAHNLSHELMHALGVANHPDTTGNYIDAASATWQLLTDPNAKFSPQAVQLLSQLLATGVSSNSLMAPGAQLFRGMNIDGAELLATPVPEPSTIAIWTAAALWGTFTLRRRSRTAGCLTPLGNSRPDGVERSSRACTCLDRTPSAMIRS
jgi:hypothetical protein